MNNEKQCDTKKNNDESHRGGRNLILLGLIALIISVSSTAVSLFVYRKSGAIYLDRSRPGYISEEEKNEQEKDNTIFDAFPDNGEVTAEVLDSYLKQLGQLKDRIDASDNFDSQNLTDENIGIYITEDEEANSEEAVSQPANNARE